MQIDFKTKTRNPMFEQVADIAPEEILEMRDMITLIDVREPFEFTGDLGHIAGATLVSVGELPEKLEQIPRDKHVVFICRSGNRSAHAAAFALDKGYTTVYNMIGGMLLWNQLNLPTERA